MSDRTLRRLAGAILLPVLLAGAPARADQTDSRLPGLFARLRAAADTTAAEAVEAEIWAIWIETDNAEAAALMRRGIAAMNAGDTRTALAAFDALVTAAPGFAEAWNKRATVYYLMGDYAASVADIKRTLALEPHHFGALSGLGLIYLGLDRPEAALKSFEAALAVHPFLPGAAARIDELRERLQGDPT